MGFVRDSLATNLVPHALPPLSALPLGAQRAQPVAPTGAPGDALPPLDLQGMLSVEPGLIDLILAAGAANGAQDDSAIRSTCNMVQAWLKTHKLGANRQAETVLWRTLTEAVFPDAPVPRSWDFTNVSREEWPVENWRYWFKEMCRRTEQYEKARSKHAKLADEAHEAQQDLHEAAADWERARNSHDPGSRISKDTLAHWSRARRTAHELSASERTALIEMNEQREFLTKWDPYSGL